MTFKHSNWSGQYSAINVHNKMQSSLQRKLEILGEEFTAQKHGRFLFLEEDPDFFPRLNSRIFGYYLTVQDNLFLLQEEGALEKEPIPRFKSAYAEDAKYRHRFKETSAGEMQWSTIPIQDPVPFTVDYIL